MILKEKDSVAPELQRLEDSLRDSGSPYDKRRIQKDLHMMRSGVKGEEDAAYHIDFYLKNSPNWVVLHDLRLECRDRVAQIDHLLINRFLEVYVIESKNYKSKVRHANGGWERETTNHRWEAMPSPVEQNRRHIEVLQDVIAELQLAPERMGIRMPFTFQNVILVSPHCSIMSDFPDGARVFKMDALIPKIRAEDPGVLSIFKMVSPETVQEMGLLLLGEHKPAAWSVPSPEKPAVPTPAAPAKPAPTVLDKCAKCGGPLTKAEAGFCRMNKVRFGGNLLCRGCQCAPAKPSLPTQAAPIGAAARCVQCGMPVEIKVVNFCRIKSKQLGGRILCQPCQKPLLAAG